MCWSLCVCCQFDRGLGQKKGPCWKNGSFFMSGVRESHQESETYSLLPEKKNHPLLFILSVYSFCFVCLFVWLVIVCILDCEIHKAAPFPILSPLPSKPSTLVRSFFLPFFFADNGARQLFFFVRLRKMWKMNPVCVTGPY